jgi:hydrogenase maturation protease
VRARIIALGERSAGDDAVGPAVLDRLRGEIERAGAFVSPPRPACVGSRGRTERTKEGASGLGQDSDDSDDSRGETPAPEWGAKSAIELLEAAGPADLIPLLECDAPVILIDAFVGPEPRGTVRELAVAEIDPRGSVPVSTHALSVRRAIDLARELAPARVTPCLRIVGICIDPPKGMEAGLSRAVADGVPRAVEEIRRILQDRA